MEAPSSFRKLAQASNGGGAELPRKYLDVMSVSSEGDDSTDSERMALALQEANLVLSTKRLMLVVLMAATALLATVTFRTIKAREKREFRTKALNHAKELISVSKVRAQNIIEAVDDVSDLISSYTVDQNMTWPLVTAPFLHAAMDRARMLSGGEGSTGLSTYIFEHDRAEYEAYVAKNKNWVPENERNTTAFIPYIWGYTESGIGPAPRTDGKRHTVLRQTVPVVSSAVNLDLTTIPTADNGSGDALINRRNSSANEILYDNSNKDLIFESVPVTTIYSPIFRNIDRQGDVVGFLAMQMRLSVLFENILAREKSGMDVFIDDSCGTGFTYRITGSSVFFHGVGDVHDRSMDRFNTSVPSHIHYNDEKGSFRCSYRFDIFPTRDFYESSFSDEPVKLSSAVIAVFVITSLAFLTYDRIVERRQIVSMASARKTGSIVNSYFPQQFRQQIMDDAQKRLKSKGVHGTSINALLLESKPIAELFPHVTVLFTDVCNFTAWSSTRQPSEVFFLLEKIYGAFDRIARKTGVFKVETIGDCYLAACGLPTPNKEHATVMARFARSCRNKLQKIVAELDEVMGPGTSDIAMRFGLHSGPVTAGVLRGEKSRFQLFGDAVNTASRIEGAGAPNQIHISKETAAYLEMAGKGHWTKKRSELIKVKGKGSIQTFWLIDGNLEDPDNTIGTESSTTATSLAVDIGGKMQLIESIEAEIHAEKDDECSKSKNDRLTTWLFGVLEGQLEEIHAKRGFLQRINKISDHVSSQASNSRGDPIDEIKREIPFLTPRKATAVDHDQVDLGEAVSEQLQSSITKIANLHHPNSFHCFEHAAHCVQSFTKTIESISKNDDGKNLCDDEDPDLFLGLGDIIRDPLVKFACIFALLISDIDQMGVRDSVLIEEGHEIALIYENRYPSKQNAIDLGWGLLMEPMYADLRACIFTNQEELHLFRQIVLHGVMATDENHGDFCEARSSIKECESINQKATVAIEMMIQAAYVSHTMQHGHVYMKWSERRLTETYVAYRSGRVATDPSLEWFETELQYFDSIVIPLVMMFDELDVVSPAADELIDHALANRAKREARGRSMIEKVVADFEH